MRAFEPPVAKRIPASRCHHGDTVIDEYAWMADADDPDTLAYAAAETAYAHARTADHAGLQEEVFGEILARTKESDLSVPVRKDGYWYYWRTAVGQQYEIYCRSAVLLGELVPPATEDAWPVPGEQVLLDGNAEAGDSEYFALGALDVTRDGDLLAYSVDRTGDERFVLRVKDLRTGQVLTDEIPDVYYGSAWSAGGSVLFYTTVDGTGRPFRVWRHAVGASADSDVLVLEEADERFWVSVQLSRSQAYVIIELRSALTSEVQLIPAAAPEQAPSVVAPRREGVDYSIDHDRRHGRLLILHNENAEDFELAWAAEASPGDWHQLIPHSQGTRLLAVAAFADGVVVSLRREGLSGLRVLPAGTSENGAGGDTSEPYDIAFPEPVYTVGLDQNLEYAGPAVRVRYMSLVTPESIYDYALATRELTLRKQAPVLGEYRPQDCEQHRTWATAQDGTPIPISILCRRGTRRDGSAPAVLYGYGSYEACAEPRFSIARLSLLDRGFVYAIAHVRGGGEMGRHWYDEGRLLAKKNTFTDFADCARYLVKAGWTSPERLVARGASAGGLLVGALANLAPDAVAGIVADSPFVDPLTTLLDPDLPLTVTEWEEWGNPLASADAYTYIKSYSPYENIAPLRYPAILALANVNDPRVLLREPLKWIARLRATAPGGDYLLKAETEGGHGGQSGRYDLWREEAFILAWIISLVRAEPGPAPRRV
jgi:oligopeptidase B